MIAYSKYKDSGIPWLGEHWETLKAKRMFVKNKRERRPEDEVITCFRDGQVTLRKNRRLTGFTESEKYDGYQGIRKGDLVIHQMDAFAGSIGVSDSDGMGTSVYHCCTPIGDYNVYYYAYLLRHMAMTGYIQSLYKGIRERSSDFSFPIFENQLLAVPPLSEQERIVAFIDDKTGKIDAYIAEREKELQTLAELKQSEIAAAVIHGLNPNVPMKDSGIPWLGQIPKHWEVEPFGRHFTFGKGLPITKSDLLPDGIAVISYGQVHSKSNNAATMSHELVRRVSPAYLTTHPQCLLQQNDFIYADTSEDIEGAGNFAFNDFNETIFAGYHTIVARPLDLQEPRYFAYQLMSQKWKSQIRSQINGVKVFSISKKILKNTYILLPPPAEQRAIVEYIDRKCCEINSLISNIEAEIAYLKEYKQRLIADAVTGAINVQ